MHISLHSNDILYPCGGLLPGPVIYFNRIFPNLFSNNKSSFGLALCAIAYTSHTYFEFQPTSGWRRQMATFPVILDLCAGNSPVTGDSPSQRPVRRSFDIFFDLRLNKRLSKQSRRWWFETPLRLSWRHCNMGFAGEYLRRLTGSLLIILT